MRDGVVRDRRWLQGEPFAGAAFAYGDAVRVLSGPHAGAEGRVTWMTLLGPEARYTVALAAGVEVEAREAALRSAHAPDPASLLAALQHRHARWTDGERERRRGVRLTTRDDGGWTLEVDLHGTALEEAPFAAIRETRTKRDRISCRVEGATFRGTCGPFQLERMVRVFTEWAAEADVPVFGDPPPDVVPRPRRAAYAVVRDATGRVAAVRARAGEAPYWLPGGAVDPDETDADAVVREVREELGRGVAHLAPAGRARERFWSADDGCWYALEAAFFHVRLAGGEAAGAEHPVEWLDPDADGRRFFLASHAWAAALPPPDEGESPTAEPATAPRIAAKAVAVVVRGGRVLLERGEDAATGGRFLRAIGGGIEFGEAASDAAAREWREELGVEIDALAPLGVLENRFTYEGVAGHEIVFVFRARLAAGAAAERDEWTAVDTDGRPHTAVWVPLADVESGAVAVVPAGLAGLLSGLA